MMIPTIIEDLRRRLDANGIEWWDESSEIGGATIYRTKWKSEGVTVSCVWGFIEHESYPGARMGVTAGWPDMVECALIDDGRIREPSAMLVQQVIERHGGGLR